MSCHRTSRSSGRGQAGSLSFHFIAVRRTNRIAVAILYSLVVAALMAIWPLIVLTGPLRGGFRWSPQRNIEYITDRHSVCLVNPAKVIRDAESGYHDWAFEEFKARGRVAAIAWALVTAGLALWAARKQDKDKSKTSPTHPTS